jgi:hypothetical protein
MRLHVVHLIVSSQFVDKMLEMRGRVCRIRTQHLLEALAHGITDRSSGFVIERCNVIF